MPVFYICDEAVSEIFKRLVEQLKKLATSIVLIPAWKMHHPLTYGKINMATTLGLFANLYSVLRLGCLTELEMNTDPPDAPPAQLRCLATQLLEHVAGYVYDIGKEVPLIHHPVNPKITVVYDLEDEWCRCDKHDPNFYPTWQTYVISRQGPMYEALASIYNDHNQTCNAVKEPSTRGGIVRLQQQARRHLKRLKQKNKCFTE